MWCPDNCTRLPLLWHFKNSKWLCCFPIWHFLSKTYTDVLERFTSICHCLQNSSRPCISFCSPDGVPDRSIRSSAKRVNDKLLSYQFSYPLTYLDIHWCRPEKKLKSIGLITPPWSTPCRFSNISLIWELYSILLLELSNILFMTLK